MPKLQFLCTNIRALDIKYQLEHPPAMQELGPWFKSWWNLQEIFQFLPPNLLRHLYLRRTWVFRPFIWVPCVFRCDILNWWSSHFECLAPVYGCVKELQISSHIHCGPLVIYICPPCYICMYDCKAPSSACQWGHYINAFIYIFFIYN